MPESVERAIRARSVWTGTISFGLVSIPVRLYPAHRSSGVSLRMLSEDGTPLARRYYDPETDREVARDDIVRGYEVEKDEFVVVTEQELEAVEPEKNRDIDLRRFVDADELDPVFFERAYFLTPDGDSTKAYRLLAAVMEDSGRAGIATFVMRTKEYLIAILAENGILRAETLRFHDEIRSVERIDLPDRPEAAAEWVESVRAAIREATEDELDEDELRDDYSRRLRSLAESKRSSGVDVREAPPEVAGGGGTDVIDLMEVLKRSLQGGEARAAEPRGADGEPTGGRTAGGSASSGRLQELTKAELYERAQALDIPGRSSMKKDELVDAIQRTG